MNGESLSGFFGPRARQPFARAFLVALVIEVALALALVRLDHSHTVIVGLHRKPMVAHLVTLPRPPAPIPPRPIHKPLPPPPKPRPVIHHRPVPLPIPVKRPPPAIHKPTPPPPPAPSPARAAQAVNRYAVMVRTRIQAGLVVPRSVVALGMSGRTTVSFELTPKGRLVWARVAHSSGFPLIDRASLAAVRAVSYPAFTQSMPHHAVVFHVRVGLNGHRHRY